MIITKTLHLSTIDTILFDVTEIMARNAKEYFCLSINISLVREDQI